MKYHVVQNGYAKDYWQYASEINGFVQTCCKTFEEGNTIIICGGQQDGDDKPKLTEMAPTKSVIFMLAEAYDPQVVLTALAEQAQDDALYIFDSSFGGQELSVRFAKRRGGSSLTGCGKLWSSGDEPNVLYGEKLIYSNHMKGTYTMEQPPYAVSIQKGYSITAMPMKREHTVNTYCIEKENRWFSEAILEKEEKISSLENAGFVVAAGWGLKSKEQADRVGEMANKIGAAYGVSRPVVMNAFRGMEELIGASGHILNPDICIAAGVSGAPAFYAGIENSAFIAAINVKEDAPIMKKADVAIVGDQIEILEALITVMGEEK